MDYEQVRQIADEMSERVNQALLYIENTDAYTDELGMVEDILRGLVDLGYNPDAPLCGCGARHWNHAD